MRITLGLDGALKRPQPRKLASEAAHFGVDFTEGLLEPVSPGPQAYRLIGATAGACA